ncbi:Hypothetical predicted protein [Octopus vulgaris]|uniref:Uncharacterized protein n=1 Tax=Octopus vulgaris TaxID=6645 RepID=A0AA36B248_OCTVU|nr:Hypothetical predicted protein [Octopus vulgaris]
MLSKDFYNVITDETKAVAFSQRNGLLDDEENAAPCHRCGGEIKKVRRKWKTDKFCQLYVAKHTAAKFHIKRIVLTR